MTHAQRQTLLRMGIDYMRDAASAENDVDLHTRYEGVEESLRANLEALMLSGPDGRMPTLVGTVPVRTDFTNDFDVGAQLAAQDKAYFGFLRRRIEKHATEIGYQD